MPPPAGRPGPITSPPDSRRPRCSAIRRRFSRWPVFRSRPCPLRTACFGTLTDVQNTRMHRIRVRTFSSCPHPLSRPGQPLGRTLAVTRRPGLQRADSRPGQPGSPQLPDLRIQTFARFQPRQRPLTRPPMLQPASSQRTPSSRMAPTVRLIVTIMLSTADGNGTTSERPVIIICRNNRSTSEVVAFETSPPGGGFHHAPPAIAICRIAFTVSRMHAAEHVSPLRSARVATAAAAVMSSAFFALSNCFQ